jgi:hypothetical protein
MDKLAAFGATVMDTRLGAAMVRVTEAETDSNPPVNTTVP